MVVSEATDHLGIIAYAKTGRLRGEDCAQVHTYMALAPLASALEGGHRPASGELVFNSGERVQIPAAETGPAFP